MSPEQMQAVEIVAGMEPWWRDVNQKLKPSRDGRTDAERRWDSGVFAASELVRRLTRDENLALAIHELCFWQRAERAKDFTTR